MTKYLVFYNSLSSNKNGRKMAEKAENVFSGDMYEYIDLLNISNMETLFSHIDNNSIVVICGGDGTLNYLINNSNIIEYKHPIYYLPCGSGNDFFRDCCKNGQPYVILNEYIKNLPVVFVNGIQKKFINGIGYGIDGYCCEVADNIRKRNNRSINYSQIAIKGLLFHYKPTKAFVTIDGKKYEYENVWLAPTMLGKYYGGGMMACPLQERLSSNHTVQTMVFSGKGRLSTLVKFPSVFSGTHTKFNKNVHILTGKEIFVEFDKPRPLQIDGETVLDVKSYRVTYKKEDNI